MISEEGFKALADVMVVGRHGAFLGGYLTSAECSQANPSGLALQLKSMAAEGTHATPRRTADR
jgi:hypothetical protein